MIDGSTVALLVMSSLFYLVLHSLGKKESKDVRERQVALEHRMREMQRAFELRDLKERQQGAIPSGVLLMTSTTKACAHCGEKEVPAQARRCPNCGGARWEIRHA
jgi:Zn finger protein HypA/HybF involved in hydrogenase expression